MIRIEPINSVSNIHGDIPTYDVEGVQIGTIPLLTKGRPKEWKISLDYEMINDNDIRGTINFIRVADAYERVAFSFGNDPEYNSTLQILNKGRAYHYYLILENNEGDAIATLETTILHIDGNIILDDIILTQSLETKITENINLIDYAKLEVEPVYLSHYTYRPDTGSMAYIISQSPEAMTRLIFTSNYFSGYRFWN